VPVSDLFSLKGRVALVTGAASGLGKAMALGLSSAGAFVVCADIAEKANHLVADEIGGDGALAVPVDVASRSSTESAAERAAGVTGSIDVLVNSAGIGGRSPATDYPPELWDSVFKINVTGTYNMCRVVGSRMVDRGSGSIVNIASIGGLVGFPGSVGYQASKGAVAQLTRTLAVEWGPAGVRVNAIAPGHIGTELVQEIWKTEPELKEFFLSRTPMGKLGRPEDVVGPALFLASGASAMVTGQILAVDGGYVAQ
jgi:gluconate 5-dehydrogenase